jgi:hypothetical protein
MNRNMMRIWFSGLVMLLSSCGDVHMTDTDCPEYSVTPDAGVTGFSSVGEMRSDAVCQKYCTKPNYSVCKLVSDYTVRCINPCG